MGRPVVVIAVAVLLMAGCRDGLAFRQDHRLVIVAPVDRAAVTVPFDVSWESRDLPPGVRFAVLVDRTPPPPGEDLAWLGRHDRACVQRHVCLRPDHLARLGIQVTDQPEIRIDAVVRPTRPGRRLHDVTVIVLQPDGRRLGELAATVTVEVVDG